MSIWLSIGVLVAMMSIVHQIDDPDPHGVLPASLDPAYIAAMMVAMIVLWPVVLAVILDERLS